jgi:acylphosphatase
VRVVVTGDVQGVGFRWSCREQAAALGVAGSVRNLPDGRVEGFFEGTPDDVQAMIDWCRRGPRWATVSAIEVREDQPLGEQGFAITR